MIHRSERLTWDKEEECWGNERGWCFCENDVYRLWGAVPVLSDRGYYTRGWRICFSTDFPHNVPHEEYDYVSLFSEYDAAVFGVHTTLPPRMVGDILRGGATQQSAQQEVVRMNERTCEDGEPGVRVQFFDSDVTDWVYEALDITHMLHNDVVPVLHLYVWVEREDVVDAAE